MNPRISELEDHLTKDNHISSTLPYSDGLRKPAPNYLRQGGQLTNSVQKGHKSAVLERVAVPDHVANHPLPATCNVCGSSLDETHVSETIQVFGIPPQQVEVTEHRAFVVCCTCGKVQRSDFPEWITAQKYDWCHGPCNAHYLQELVMVHKLNGQCWAKKMNDLLFAANRGVADGLPTDERIEQINADYTAIPDQGNRVHPIKKRTEGTPHRGQLTSSSQLRRLHEYREVVLCFLSDPEVPFTNNIAEQAVRIPKSKQKIFGCFRTFDGAAAFCRIRSYLETLYQQGIDLGFTRWFSVFRGKPAVPHGVTASQVNRWNGCLPLLGPAAGSFGRESPLDPDGIKVPRWKFHPREGQGGLVMQVTTYGLDLAKRVMQLHWVDMETGEIHRKQLRRQALLEFFANRQPGLVAMESCGSAHYWGRELRKLGHEVRLVAAQFVRPFVKANKNDAADAAAIWETVQRPDMRFVAVKSEEQQSVLALHRMREQLIKIRTMQVNQIRGLLYEFGADLPQGRQRGLKEVPDALANLEDSVSPMTLDTVRRQLKRLGELDQDIADIEKRLTLWKKDQEAVSRLMTIPGVGLLTATAIIATVGDMKSFRSGREFAAFLGLVPRQSGTGGKVKLLGISKRGDVYLRTLLTHGARVVVNFQIKNRNPWIDKLLSRRSHNVAVVAVANKMARTIWALLVKNSVFETNHTAVKAAA